MPLKLNIAMSRKVGEPNYGSRGATVGLEMEVDSGLVDQPRQLHARIARLFRLAKASVDRELSGGERNCRLATTAQVRAIYAIARKQQLDLTVELNSRFGLARPEDLTVDEASGLISTAWQSTARFGSDNGHVVGAAPS